MNNKELIHEVQGAKTDVTDAEGDLTRLISELQAASRAEKTTISLALTAALNKLRAAREHLVKLEELARAPED